MEDVELFTTVKTVASATMDIILNDYVPPSRLLHVTTVRIEDGDNNVTSFDLVIERSGLYHSIASYVPATGAKVHTFIGDFYVPSNARIGVALYGAVVGDRVALTINGLYLT